MGFKLPDIPSVGATASELADYMELIAWLYGQCSASEVQTALTQQGDNHFNVGIDDEDDEREEITTAMLTEIKLRSDAVQIGYPFIVSDRQTVLRYDDSLPSKLASIYCYLLLATRLNMQTQRTHADINGTDLLEELSAAILKNYLGRYRALSLVFGTAERGSFSDKINHLCSEIGEGHQFDSRDVGQTHANDDGVDVVGWIPFTDGLPSKLSVFAQCKTGTNWRETVGRLRPDVFINQWMLQSFVLNPIQAFFIAESHDRDVWSHRSGYAGLFFDRCRIVDFAEKVDDSLLKKVQKWTFAARVSLLEESWARNYTN